MTPERMERIRTRSERAMRSGRGTVEHRQAMEDRSALLAEVDRLRAALTRISGHGERCRLACGRGWDSTCGCGSDAGHIADAALEGTP